MEREISLSGKEGGAFKIGNPGYTYLQYECVHATKVPVQQAGSSDEPVYVGGTRSRQKV